MTTNAAEPVYALLASLPVGWLIVAGGLLGAILGSFTGTLVVRWPEGQSVSTGRSRCDGCGRSLGVVELIPVLSFLIAQGRCRGCSNRIDPVHFIAELLSMITGALAFALLPADQAIWAAILCWILVPIALLDLRWLWLPDRLLIFLAAFGIFDLLLAPEHENTIATLIAVICSYLAMEGLRLAFLKLRGVEGMGKGDPKLLAALAFWIAWYELPALLLIASVTGLMLALIFKLRGNPRRKIPFGTCLAFAAMLIVLLDPFGLMIGV